MRNRLITMVVLGGLAASVPAAAGTGGKLTGDARGIALVAKINNAYRPTPGVSITAATAGLTVVFKAVLDKSIISAEEAIVTHGTSRSLLVGTTRDGTYAKDSGSNCWRFVPASDPQALTDIGHPILQGPGRVDPPQTERGRTKLVIHQGTEVRTFVTAPATLRLRTATLATGSNRATLRFTDLPSAPRLPTTRPHC